MVNIEKLLTELSAGIGDRAGCNDADEVRAKDWINLAKSDNPQDHELLIGQIRESVAYGG